MQHETVKIADILFATALPAAPGLLTAKRGLLAAKRGIACGKTIRTGCKIKKKGEKMRASPLDARALLC